MVSIVLASHGDLAAGIKQTGSMVFGDQPSVAVVSLEPSMGPDDFRAKVEEAVASFEDQEQVLFLVDLWGGTPFNQISGLIEGHDSWAIVTGVNLPMLIEAYSQRFDAKNTAHAIAKHLVTEAKAGVRVKPESLEPEEKKPAAAAAAPAGAIPPGTVIGDGHIKIAHVRIDTRLLHGQVAVSWVQGLGSDCIFCVGDKVANDPVWKTTLKMGKPANVKLVIKDMEHAIEAINSGVTDKYKMIICVASIAEAKQLVDGCPQITSINLGNTKSKDEQRPDARKISRQIFVTAAEEEDIRELVGRGVEVEIRALADDPKVDALSAL